ncbi:MAG: sigma 54-interacting transcriptional regulator [bacterium]
MTQHKHIHSTTQKMDFYVNLKLTDQGVVLLNENLTPKIVRVRGPGAVRTRGGAGTESKEKPTKRLKLEGVINGIKFSVEFAHKKGDRLWIDGEARRGKDKLRVEFWTEDQDYLGRDFARIPAAVDHLLLKLFEPEGHSQLVGSGNVSLMRDPNIIVKDEDKHQFDKPTWVSFTEESWTKYAANTLDWDEPLSGTGMICGKGSSTLEGVVSMISKAALSNSPVLILGETGTGKELVAKAIHNLSSRQNRPFIAVNTGAIPKELITSELFGHVKGAFTGAIGERKGKFQEADRGTIFLDEIGTMTSEVQVSLLRVLEEKVIERVGSNTRTAVDVRIIAATNANLERLMEEERFRQDLYYRLNALIIKLPPLRERIQDIPALVCYYSCQFGNNVRYAEDLFKSLIWYHWPGNVRQLRDFIKVTQNE